MIHALLVDLDDTLLENDLSRFIPAYFDLLAEELSAFAPKERVLTAILAGTKAMVGNEDPRRTLAEIFYQVFQSATGADPAAVADSLGHFYAQTYPRLASLTHPKEGAAALLRAASARGLEIAVATNPLMIRPAIEQRLSWAGVPTPLFPYALISDVETFHFAKPRPAFFAEALAYLGRLPSEAVMVGNDQTEDLDPAAALGLPVFHVTSAPDGEASAGGPAEAVRWLESRLEEERPSVTRPEALIARFEGQLAAVLTKMSRLEDGELRLASDDGGLAPLQIVCHLRDVDREVNLPRLETILQQDDPFFSPVDTDSWIEARAYLAEQPAAALQGFVAARQDVTATLRLLAPEQWQRRVRHSLLGPMSLADWMAVLAEHDLRHMAQIPTHLERRPPPAFSLEPGRMK